MRELAMRYLIVRLGSIGDIVHALPVAEALRAHDPGAEIAWVVERSQSPVLELSPAVSTIVTLETRRLAGPRGWWPVVRELRQRRYEVAFDAQGLLKSAIVARASGARRVVGWTPAALREPLAARFYTERIAVGAGGHVIDKNLTLLEALGLERPEPVFRLEEGPAAPWIDEVLPAGARTVVINPGGNWPNKRWPPDRFGALAARLRARHGLQSLVLWGPGDEALADAVVAASAGAAVRAPATTIGEVVAVARRAAVVVSGDTAPLHLACAVGTPVVGIHGPTDPRRNGPWRPGDEIVSRFETCECPYQRACRARRWCLADVGVDEVADAVSRRLSGASDG